LPINERIHSISGDFMKEKPREPEIQQDLFRTKLENIIDLRHELCQLGEKIDWKKFEKEFERYFPSGKGNPALSSRLVVGMMYLKYAYGVSDEEAVERWIESPYWQYFCGMEYFQHEVPMHPTSFVKWRKRLGEKGCEKLLEEIIQVGLRTKVIEEKDFKKVTVDTTVQEKAITYPTDSKLQHRARILLIREAKRRGIKLRQTYLRVGKQALFKGSKYAAAQQMKRARKQFKLTRKYLGCVYRDIQRKLKKMPEQENHFMELLEKTERLLTQKREDKKKLYSLHAPEVECIGKGKAQKRYEFGVKTSIVATHKSNFVVGIQALPGNPYDGHTLSGALDQVEFLTGIRPEDSYVDLGYRGHGEEKTEVHISRTKKNLRTRALRKAMNRRSAIEPIIGHMKENALFRRNHLKGTVGDKLNALLNGVGYDVKIILRRLRIFWLRIFWLRFDLFLRRFFRIDEKLEPVETFK
jgi:transposase, IS5 family